MNRVPTFPALALLGLLTSVVTAQQPAVAPHNEVVIKNAVVMTVTHGNIPNGSVYIKDGKIAAFGKEVKLLQARP